MAIDNGLEATMEKQSRKSEWMGLVVTVVLAIAALAALAAQAQTILSGSALQTGCRDYATKALTYAREWEQLQCLKRLNEAPQLFTTEPAFHDNRCQRSVGTTIQQDLRSMEEMLAKCRGAAPVPTRPGTVGRPPPVPTQPPVAGTAALWDIAVTNSADLARSEHTFMAALAQGGFTAQNSRAGGPALQGKVAGQVFEAVMTDATGYRATFVGRFAKPGRIEGTGCDNRGRSFSFTMSRR